jgi:hypothetical protein
VSCNISLKIFRWRLQLCFRPHLDQRSAHKVMGPQSCESPKFGNFETPTWESWNKMSFGCGLMERHIVYYKGESGGFPQVRAVVSLVCPCCLWLVLAPKVLQLCTNHFVWIMCRPVWMSETFQLFRVPSRSSNMPLYPSKCCELGSVLWLLLFRCFLLGFTFEPFKELGVRHNHSRCVKNKMPLHFPKGANWLVIQW